MVQEAGIKTILKKKKYKKAPRFPLLWGCTAVDHSVQRPLLCPAWRGGLTASRTCVPRRGPAHSRRAPRVGSAPEAMAGELPRRPPQEPHPRLPRLPAELCSSPRPLLTPRATPDAAQTAFVQGKKSGC